MKVSTRPRRVTYVLIEGHLEVERLFQQLQRPDTDPRHRAELLTMVIAELNRHAAAKRLVLYPAIRALFPDGDEVVGRALVRDQQAEEVTSRLERTSAEHPPTDVEVDGLILLIRRQIIEEEQELFPRVIGACTPDQLVDLGGKVEQAMLTASRLRAPAR